MKKTDKYLPPKVWAKTTYTSSPKYITQCAFEFSGDAVVEGRSDGGIGEDFGVPCFSLSPLPSLPVIVVQVMFSFGNLRAFANRS
ncbi:MAG: hypothetical protein AABZ58_05550, partial [Chloroflexota bacterium]